MIIARVSDSKSVVFAVDLARGIKYPDIDTLAAGFLIGTSAIDFVSISPLGGLIYVNGQLNSGQNQNDNAKVFDLQGNVVSTWLEYGVPSHADLSVSIAGDEVVIGVVKTATSGITAGHIAMRSLKTGTLTDLDIGGFPTAASTRCYGMTGWAVIDDAGISSPNNYPPYNDEIFAVRLDSAKVVVRLGQTHSTYSDYETQGFVVPSPDGLRIAFASSWNAVADANGNRRPVQTYVIDIRQNLGLS